MNLLFIIDPPEGLKAYKDTTVSMMRAAQRRGHQVHVCTQDALAWHAGPVNARAVHIALTDNDEDWYRRDGSAERALKDFGAVLMRKDPPFDMEYVASTWLLSEAERQGARVFNAPQALRDLNEKFAIAEFAALTVPALVTRDMALLQAFIDEHGDTILKPLAGMGGAGIFRVRRDDPNRNVIVETLAAHGAVSVMAQRFIPEITEGDKRIILIEGRPAPYVLARIPKAGETRGNLAVGGKGVAQPLSARDRQIAEAMGPALAARGILFAGLDVIGNWLTEVNVTSPTCFREIQDLTGYDAAAVFVEALEARVAR
ncbi:MAG: glutathione synthase [Proteobacteria bacterium]|nr:glutathione synthase [Pseudomonadota bacterium]